MFKSKKLYIYAGFIWCFLFALMSFYWASGGMIGTKSLGGSIYQHALEREEAFITVVWITGFVKLGGGLVLLLLLRDWSKIINRILYFLSFIGGVFLFLYGMANFITILLSSFGLLSLQINNFALSWRLFFWEPFWMLGGFLFILSALMYKKDNTRPNSYDI
ncbi:DUF3995 domain-containing protein [Lederbergia citrea]|uniref:DUF3995 domain-containing protein n=1 Tax=Lederbergia citrea TaxID=2833581 RepID=UPI00201692CB|nr:DUF3995 domain-containing protein [Lederbergia citrea]